MASKNNVELIKKILEVLVKSNGYDAVMKNVRQMIILVVIVVLIAFLIRLK